MTRSNFRARRVSDRGRYSFTCRHAQHVGFAHGDGGVRFDDRRIKRRLGYL